MGRSSKCVVIDTDIARAASSRDSIDPRPKDCEKLLRVVRDTKHKVVRSEAIGTEMLEEVYNAPLTFALCP